MPRIFFISPEAIDADAAILDGPEAHHILHVLRLKKGSRIELFDGTGYLYSAVIKDISRDKIFLTLLSSISSLRPKPELHLATPLLKGKKLELVLQKAVELGVMGLHPFISTYCDKQSARGDSSDRWQRIILEACKQCGQPLLPQLSPMTSFSELLQNAPRYEHILLCYEKENSRKISDIPLTPSHGKRILLITGPEGGFSDSEISYAQRHNCAMVSLGPLTLRAETAAIAVLAIVQHRLGFLG
jgi:16S rRNA (uracil1498-N3)-methyltransferase